MSTWFYDKDGTRDGPVSESKIRSLIRSGTLTSQDRVYREGMEEWTAISSVRELSSPAGSAEAGPPVTPLIQGNAGDPAAAESTEISFDDFSVELETTPEDILHDLTGPPPSLPIGLCLARAWQFTRQHFGRILFVGIVYLLIAAALNLLAKLFAGAVLAAPLYLVGALAIQVYLVLGLLRFGLNIVSNRQVSRADLFSQGDLILRGMAAFLIYGLFYGIIFYGMKDLMDFIATEYLGRMHWSTTYAMIYLIPLTIVYLLAVRFSFFGPAMVERDLGILDSFRYSMTLTRNNTLSLFILGFLCHILIVGLFTAVLVLFLLPLIVTIPHTPVSGWLAILLPKWALILAAASLIWTLPTALLAYHCVAYRYLHDGE